MSVPCGNVHRLCALEDCDTRPVEGQRGEPALGVEKGDVGRGEPGSSRFLHAAPPACTDTLSTQRAGLSRPQNIIPVKQPGN